MDGDGSETRLPWGLRFVSGFLIVIAMVLILPLLAAGVSCFLTLTMADHEHEHALLAFGLGFLSLILFLGLLVLCLGAGWLDQYIRRSHGRRFLSEPGDFRCAVIRPDVISAALCSAYAFGVGIFIRVFLDAGSSTWILCWLATFGAAFGCYLKWGRID